MNNVATQFTFTVSQRSGRSVYHYNIISPDGCYSSGSRHTLTECFEALEKKIKEWNSLNEHQTLKDCEIER